MSFNYKISYEGTLTRGEADLIYDLLLSRSDTRRYVEQGEFAFCFVNYFDGQDVTRSFSSAEIGIMIEVLYSDWRRDHAKDAITKLSGWINEILEEHQRICTRPSSVPRTDLIREMCDLYESVIHEPEEIRVISDADALSRAKNIKHKLIKNSYIIF